LQGIKWQGNFFDHRIRNEHQGVEKWRYIRRNPVVKELCREEAAWPFWWSGTLSAGGSPRLNALPSTRLLES
jgi:hypothetical protein